MCNRSPQNTPGYRIEMTYDPCSSPVTIPFVAPDRIERSSNNDSRRRLEVRPDSSRVSLSIRKWDRDFFPRRRYARRYGETTSLLQRNYLSSCEFFFFLLNSPRRFIWFVIKFEIYFDGTRLLFIHHSGARKAVQESSYNLIHQPRHIALQLPPTDVNILEATFE